ncbi:transcriptional regulator Fis [Gluconobacter thailandicus F149-1 = NBRC 100600]|uniref:Transcriptional regulator n=1 Tax=Gluconobacter thailandicus NBRC 3257 TaxID=1381097 RepID=A0ABQ0IU22_GLUTH|nr:helix-turn-helix domain-containing protein [Gluconobacter thailandicus]AFW01157.1 transcriptional regulator [Gluconobacter oxydans H24]ANQ40213.1 transcriptional regulator [Gluconobacter oxydans]GAN90555.1 transcriptional regulator Fis [Gluconobacter frateurii M-2]KXV54211.1 transcriptional regulator [Gluconobacter thailandicus]GAC89112.1 transcriptional regulator [Gluconobacter thailandicus NBRC 3255]
MNRITPQAGLSDSWTRCSANYNLDPAERWETRLLSAPELRFVSNRTRLLIQHALPEMERLHSLVMALGFTVMLADANGVVLSRQTSREDLTGCRRWGFQAGALWDEENAGTNSIGTCLQEKKPVMVLQSQHWRLCFRNLTGIAAPLYNANGKLAGVLNICSFAGNDIMPFSSLLMETMISTARQIEERLFRQFFPNETIITLGLATESSTPLVALDPDGHVRGATHSSRMRMHWPDGELEHLPALMNFLDSEDELSFRKAEVHVIRSALATTQGNVSAAARTLGVSRSTLHRKIKALNLPI